MSVATLPKINTAGLTLLMHSEEKFRQGDTKGAVEDFQAASAVLQREIISKIYWNVWDLSSRPSGNSNFGEEAMLNRLVSHSAPDNHTKAEAIRLAVVKFHLDTVGSLLKRLEGASSCPLSLEEMKDPVIDFDGHTFDRSQIQEHYRHLLREGKFRAECPLTRQKGSTELIPNYSVKEVVEIYKEFGARLGHLAVFVQSLYDENKKLEAEIGVLRKEKETLASRQIKPEQELILLQFQRLIKQSAERDQMWEDQFRLWGEERSSLTQQISELRELQVFATREQIRMTQQLSERHRLLSERQEQLDAAQQQLAVSQRQLSERHLQLISLQQELAAANLQLAEERRSRQTEREDSLKVLQSYNDMDFCKRFTFFISGH